MDLTRKTDFYEEWSWFKLSNLRLALLLAWNFTAVWRKGPNKISEDTCIWRSY